MRTTGGESCRDGEGEFSDARGKGGEAGGFAGQLVAEGWEEVKFRRASGGARGSEQARGVRRGSGRGKRGEGGGTGLSNVGNSIGQKSAPLVTFTTGSCPAVCSIRVLAVRGFCLFSAVACFLLRNACQRRVESGTLSRDGNWRGDFWEGGRARRGGERGGAQ